VVAPATEQSGVGHSITFLTPLTVKEVYIRNERWGWAVQGSPADCVKLGINQFCPRYPDLVVSGINYGSNAGINVLYSGTVAAAVEGAFFGITSIAVSVQFDPQPQFDKAAVIARSLIEQILAQKGPGPQLFNLNIPTAALSGSPTVATVPMAVNQYNERFEKRVDPFGRDYYWPMVEPIPPATGPDTDLSALAKGHVTLTPLDFNLTRHAVLAQMGDWRLEVPVIADCDESAEALDSGRPILRTGRLHDVAVGRRHKPATPHSSKIHDPQQ
jgi:5'-nucleotidase